MHFSKGLSFAFVALTATAWFGGVNGCSGSSETLHPEGGAGSDDASASGGGSSSGTISHGVCTASCEKQCSVDADCNTAVGEACCDLGLGTRVCQTATTCPQICATDSSCTTSGQKCVSISVAPAAEKECALPSAGVTLCATDSDCGTGAPKCCSLYAKPICTP